MTPRSPRILTRILGLLVSGLVASSPGTALAGGSAPMVVDVAVATPGPDADELEDAIESRVLAQLESLGHDVRTEGTTRLSVEVAWDDELQTTYSVAVSVERVGRLVAHAHHRCANCGTPELFEVVRSNVERVTQSMAESDNRGAQTAAAADEPERPVSSDSSQEQRFAALGWSGVAIAGLGVVMGAIGAGVWSKGEVIDSQEPSRAVVSGTDYRPPGIALVATGSVLLAGGVVMVVVDAVRARRARARSRLTAAFDPRGTASVIITGRF